MARERETMGGDSSGRDLGRAVRPSGGGGAGTAVPEAGSLGRTAGVRPEPPPPSDPATQVAQLAQLLRGFVETGVIQQRPDGALLVPGLTPAPGRTNSACHCARCTAHNQHHWICMICGSVHEWVMVTDRPITMRQILGDAGRAGQVHLVCSQACALAYRQQYGSGVSGLPQVGTERLYPVAGGDDPYGFFVTEAGR